MSTIMLARAVVARVEWGGFTMRCRARGDVASGGRACRSIMSGGGVGLGRRGRRWRRGWTWRWERIGDLDARSGAVDPSSIRVSGATVGIDVTSERGGLLRCLLRRWLVLVVLYDALAFGLAIRCRRKRRKKTVRREVSICTYMWVHICGLTPHGSHADLWAWQRDHQMWSSSPSSWLGPWRAT